MRLQINENGAWRNVASVNGLALAHVMNATLSLARALNGPTFRLVRDVALSGKSPVVVYHLDAPFVVWRPA